MPKQGALPPSLPPRLVTREVAAAYVGVSPNTFDELEGRGLMPKARVIPGLRRKLHDLRELDIAVDALPHDGEDTIDADHGWT